MNLRIFSSAVSSIKYVHVKQMLELTLTCWKNPPTPTRSTKTCALPRPLGLMKQVAAMRLQILKMVLPLPLFEHLRILIYSLRLRLLVRLT